MAEDKYIGKTIDGKYVIQKLLGSGGMGTVYLARHKILKRKVAVKFLHAQFASKDKVLKRFYREAQAAAEIGHENIAEVSDMGVSEVGEPFLVMEFLDGENLAQLLERTGPMSLPAALAILDQVLQGLFAAHNKGIVHRDLKPENIYLARQPHDIPMVKLIDFGVSKFTNSTQTKLTKEGTMLGTPMYMSPEQVRGELSIDHRSDLYSIGVIMYQMLTGTVPFAGVRHHEVLLAVLTKEPTPPKDAYSSFPDEAEPIITKLLAKKAAERYRNADELLKEITKLPGFNDRQKELKNSLSSVVPKTMVVQALDMPASGVQSQPSSPGNFQSQPSSPGSMQSQSDIPSQSSVAPSQGGVPSTAPAPAQNDANRISKTVVDDAANSTSAAQYLSAIKEQEDKKNQSVSKESSSQISSLDSMEISRRLSLSSSSTTLETTGEVTPKNNKMFIFIAAAAGFVVLASMITFIVLKKPAPKTPEPTTAPLVAPTENKQTEKPNSEETKESPKKAENAVTINITARPAFAQIKIDGAKVDNPYNGEFAKSSLNRTVHVSADGYEEITQILTFNTNIKKVFNLTPLQEEPDEQSPKDKKPSHKKENVKKENKPENKPEKKPGRRKREINRDIDYSNPWR